MARKRRGALAAAAAAAVAAALLLLGIPAAPRALAAESLSVNLAAVTGPSTAVGEGFLYGVSQDGTQPADQYTQPLGITAFRGGGHVTGGWVDDGYAYGSGTQADVNTVIAQARRLSQAPYHAQYQALLSDIWGADGGQPSNTVYPCANGNCSNWVTFIDKTVGALQASGPEVRLRHLQRAGHLRVLADASVNSTQYFQMWDTAYQEIRRIAPGATIVGPVVRLHPAAPGRVEHLAGPRQGRREPSRTRSPTTTRATSTTRSRSPRPSTATCPRPGSRRPVVGQRVPARRPADRRCHRLVPGPFRAVRLHQRHARQLGLLHDTQPHRGPHPERRQPGSRTATGGRCAPTPT